MDVIVKLNENNKKQIVIKLKENKDDSENNSSNDDQEKEKEKEIEDDSEDENKELNQIILLSHLTERNLATLQKYLKHRNLPSGFFKTFTPPPEHNTFSI